MSVDRTSPSQSALNALVDAMAPFLKLYETYRANAWAQGLHALELDAWAKAYVSDVERLREAAEQSRLAVEFARQQAEQATAERNGAIALVNTNQEAFDALRAENAWLTNDLAAARAARTLWQVAVYEVGNLRYTAIFDTREAADAAAALVGDGGDWRVTVTEYALNDASVPPRFTKVDAELVDGCLWATVTEYTANDTGALKRFTKVDESAE